MACRVLFDATSAITPSGKVGRIFGCRAGVLLSLGGGGANKNDKAIPPSSIHARLERSSKRVTARLPMGGNRKAAKIAAAITEPSTPARAPNQTATSTITAKNNKGNFGFTRLP